MIRQLNKTYKRVVVLTALFLFTAIGIQAQDSTWQKSYVDTALLGTWKLENPNMLRMFRSSGEPFLREVIIFRDREMYEVPRERHPWSWDFSMRTQEIEIADVEELVLRGYPLKYLDKTTLIILLGKQEIIYKKVQ